MAEHPKEEVVDLESGDAPDQRLSFIGIEQAVGLFADAFLVARKEDSCTIYFFQQSLPEQFEGVLRQSKRIEGSQARCIGKIIMSPQGAVKLAEGLANNFGLTVLASQEPATETE